MNDIRLILSFVIIITITGNVKSENNMGNNMDYPKGEDFTITWFSLYQVDGEERFLQRMDLKNTGVIRLPAGNWALYFNSIPRIIPESINPEFKLRRINGHFYEIKPAINFKPLNPGDVLQITFVTQTPAIKESDMPTGFYLVYNEDNNPQSIKNVEIGAEIMARQTVRTNNDNKPVTTPESRYIENKNITHLGSEEVDKILPRPLDYKKGESYWPLDSEVQVHYPKVLENEAIFLIEKLEKMLGRKVSKIQGKSITRHTINLNLAEIEVAAITRKAGDEAYRLEIDRDRGVIITGSDRAGVFYGIQSLLAMMPVETYGILSDTILYEEVLITDAPRFSYRGLHLDVARNFQSKQTVLKLLDIMSFYKLNKFHFHLTDDEGWRLEIQSLPELTDTGARRGHTIDEGDRLIPSFGSGPNVAGTSKYYTQEDFIEILKYAHKRHIDVIPEIDIPGHARAAIKAMEARYHRLRSEGKEKEASAYRLIDPDDSSVYRSAQNFNDNVINVCLPSTYRFLELVIDEIVDLYQQAEVPLTIFHVGGDEVPTGAWTKSPVCDQLISNEALVKDIHSLPDYFLRRVNNILADRGLQLAGWEEIALIENQTGKKPSKIPNKKYLDYNFIPFVWNTVWGWGAEDLGYRLANSGYKIVICNAPNLYFDCACNKDPKEPGLYWPGFVDTRRAFEFTPLDIFKSATTDRLGNPINLEQYQNHVRLSESGKKNVLGIQGQLWGELLVDSIRLDYMAFPKLLGLAERAWSVQPDWAMIENVEKQRERIMDDWNKFINCVGQREMVRLDRIFNGIGYRIPRPGAIIENGILKANVAYPGLDIRYTTDKSEPNAKSSLYKSPIPVKDMVKLRTFNSIGRGSRTVTLSAP